MAFGAGAGDFDVFLFPPAVPGDLLLDLSGPGDLVLDFTFFLAFFSLPDGPADRLRDLDLLFDAESFLLFDSESFLLFVSESFFTFFLVGDLLLAAGDFFLAAGDLVLAGDFDDFPVEIKFVRRTSQCSSSLKVSWNTSCLRERVVYLERSLTFD